MVNRYSTLGLGFTLFGFLLGFVSYFVLVSIPFTALGISTFILGCVCFALSRGQARISSEVSEILLEAGMENVSAIVEELGLKSKAVYLPSSLANGKLKVLIPLKSNPDFEDITKNLPKRLIVKFGKNDEDVGILIVPPGSGFSDKISAIDDAKAADIESGLESILVGNICLVDSVKVTMGDGRILVEVSNYRLESNNLWIYGLLGSPLASMIASVVAEILDKPVSVVSEDKKRAKNFVELSVV